jgi:nucleoside 2-deoxyribosyltransferase
MKIYVASSWRNTIQPGVVNDLRNDGHDVYDFRQPVPGDNGFHWSEIDKAWQTWSPSQFRLSLTHDLAESGFRKDAVAMRESDVCVLVLPCGRSAHLEAGYFVGAGKPLFILLDDDSEPELMYKMATGICAAMGELRGHLNCIRHNVKRFDITVACTGGAAILQDVPKDSANDGAATESAQ